MKASRKWLRKCGQLIAGSAIALSLGARTQGPRPATNGELPALSPETLFSTAAEEMCSPSVEDAREAASVTPAGGDLPARRYVVDPYPTFNGLALDVENDRVVMSDQNRKSLLSFPRDRGNNPTAPTEPTEQIVGPHTEIGYVAGVELDRQRREIFVANNDIEDRIAVFDYKSDGDVRPKRHLYTPHQTWGISLNAARDEIAISVQQLSAISIYRRTASGLEAHLRVIKGPRTRMADPHGIRWDADHHEIAVANHGNAAEITAYSSDDPTRASLTKTDGGKFWDPSISFFAENAEGDTPPLRTIQGPHTQLNWPMGIDLDDVHNEIAVANNGADSVLIFARTASGDVAPLRVIRGKQTGVSSPMAVAIDTQHEEVWVANYGDHSALVFARDASGDVAPKRIIRNAPAGTPTAGFGNPYALAYDSKRDQLLVPN